MKLKVKALIALSVYLLGSVGITVNYHYCGGHLVDIAFYYVDEENCCGEQEEEDHNCCNNEFLVLDTDDSEGIHAYKCTKQCCGSIVFHPAYTSELVIYNNLIYNHCIISYDHGPPGTNKPPSFILNHVLII